MVSNCPDTKMPWLEDPYILPFNIRTPQGFCALQVFTDTLATRLAAAIPGCLPGMGADFGRHSKFSPIGKFLAHFRQHIVTADLRREIKATLANWNDLVAAEI